MNLKKINRGVILGCIAALVTAGYVVYDNHQFSKNKGNIANSVENYLTELADVRCSSKDQKEISSAYKEIVGKYWTSSDFSQNGYEMFLSKNQINAQIVDPTNHSGVSGYFSKYNIKINDVTVSKYGNNGALVVVSYLSACEFNGSPLDINAFGIATIDNENYDENGLVNSDVSLKYKQTASHSDTYYLTNVDGKWKIAGSYQSMMGDAKTIRVDDESSNEIDTESKSQQEGGAEDE